MRRFPDDDPSSLGQIMMAYGVRPSELTRALRFQRDHPGMRLGEVCLHLGFIDEVRLEISVRKQGAVRARGAGALVELATERTNTMAESVGTLAGATKDALERAK